jgi:hypothetical protein
MDVGGWLRSLGLGQYEALFRASDIDADILPELTELDLEKLGVARSAAGSPALDRALPRATQFGARSGDRRRMDGVWMFHHKQSEPPMNVPFETGWAQTRFV